jgi:hypothetical protein
MSRRSSILILTILMLLLAACGAQFAQQGAKVEFAAPTAGVPVKQALATASQMPTQVSERVPESCPIKRPQNPLFVPPRPWPPQAPYGEFWYGTADLWTAVRPDGIWSGLPHESAGYTQKVWFWKQGYNGAADPTPNLTVTGRRLDGSAPPLTASKATNGYHPDFDWAMLVGVDIPTLGCWEITGHSEGHDLSFVVRVAQ